MDHAVKSEKSAEGEIGEALCIVAILTLLASLVIWVTRDVLVPLEQGLKAHYPLF